MVISGVLQLSNDITYITLYHVASFFQLEETPLEDGIALDMLIKPTQTKNLLLRQSTTCLSGTAPFPPRFLTWGPLGVTTTCSAKTNKTGKTTKFGLYIMMCIIFNPCTYTSHMYIESVSSVSPLPWSRPRCQAPLKHHLWATQRFFQRGVSQRRGGCFWGQFPGKCYDSFKD